MDEMNRDAGSTADARGEAPLASEIRWSVHLAREKPLAAVVASVAIMALAWLAGQAGQHWAWSLFALVVLMVTLGRFYFPCEYRVTNEGITYANLLTRRELAWKDIRRMDFGAAAVWLSTYRQPSAMEARRGFLVQLGDGAEERGALLRRLAPQARVRGRHSVNPT